LSGRSDDALALATSSAAADELVVVAGSLYLIAEVRALLLKP
jgi:folylpolyglutamate synthase/dihydropteroate synthase